MNRPVKPGFGKRLRAERERLGFTQAELAALVGTQRVTQYLYENEDNSPTFRYLTAIAEQGVDLAFLCFGEPIEQGKYFSDSLKFFTDLFILVDKYGRDAKGKPLPLDARVNFFRLLAASLAEKQGDSVDIENIVQMLSA